MSRGHLIAVGFGTSVVMWAAGYFARLPGSALPGSALAAIFGLALLAGGAFAAHTTGRGWRAGLEAMAVSSLVNLLLVGSVAGGRHASGAALTGSVPPRELFWIPGTVLAGAILGALGGAAASRWWPRARRDDGSRAGGPGATVPADIADAADHANAALARVAVAATLMLLLVGGVVTSENAGLAVVDWPNSYGYNMFLYPLARMTGPIYFEHAHRLFGSLVGLTTLVLAIRLAITERRAWLKVYGFAVLLLVAVQGLLGGLRVTGKLTMSQSPADTSPSLALAVIHGVTAQLFLGSLVALAVFLTPGWRRASAAHAAGDGGAARDEFRLSLALVVSLVIQLVLGALQRHLARGISVHMMMAGIVAILAYAAGARAWSKADRFPLMGRVGVALIAATTVQLGLGFGALVTTGALAGQPVTTTASVIIATAHQTTGAALLALAVVNLLWNARLGAGAREPVPA